MDVQRSRSRGHMRVSVGWHNATCGGFKALSFYGHVYSLKGSPVNELSSNCVVVWILQLCYQPHP